MKIRAQRFDPPITEDIGGGITLVVTGAEPDKAGDAKVSLELWNGTLKAKDKLLLASELSRKRFVKQAQDGEPSCDLAALARALLKLANQMPALMAEPDDAAASIAVDPTDDELANLLEQARPLLESPTLLDDMATALGQLGLAGERIIGKLLYLAATARLDDKPVNVIVKGTSSAGKSHTLKTVMALFPRSTYIDYTSVSPKYLAYSQDDLRHRIIVLYEAGGVAEGQGAYIMRSLLSEGRLHIGTVDKGEDDSLQGRSIDKEGPTALFTSTTRAAVDPELETRALSVSVNESMEQSRLVVKQQASEYGETQRAQPNLIPWHALQDWLQRAGERRVVIPYARRLSELIPVKVVRVRRDNRTLLALIAASARLHQLRRERTAQGAIIANRLDYEVARELGESFMDAQREGLTEKQREVVEAVIDLHQVNQSGVTQAQVREWLSAKGAPIQRSSVKRRLDPTVKAGYVRNVSTDKNHPLYIPGDPLPDDDTGLPLPEVLFSDLRDGAL